MQFSQTHCQQNMNIMRFVAGLFFYCITLNCVWLGLSELPPCSFAFVSWELACSLLYGLETQCNYALLIVLLNAARSSLWLWFGWSDLERLLRAFNSWIVWRCGPITPHTHTLHTHTLSRRYTIHCQEKSIFVKSGIHLKINSSTFLRGSSTPRTKALFSQEAWPSAYRQDQ